MKNYKRYGATKISSMHYFFEGVVILKSVRGVWVISRNKDDEPISPIDFNTLKEAVNHLKYVPVRWRREIKRGYKQQ